MFHFGYKPYIDAAKWTYGARAVMGKNGSKAHTERSESYWLHLLPDRGTYYINGNIVTPRTWEPKEQEEITRVISSFQDAQKEIINNWSNIIKHHRIHQSYAEEHIIHEKDNVRVIGNTNASNGYFYMQFIDLETLKEEQPDATTDNS